MSLKAKRELLFRIWSRYLDADKHEKTVILNGFVAATGYQRKYAIALLNRSYRHSHGMDRVSATATS